MENVVQANLLAATVPDIQGTVFNVGCGESHTLNDLCREIERATGRGLRARHGPAREGDVRHSQADITLARRRLGYQPAIPFREGIERTAAWMVAAMAPAPAPISAETVLLPR